MQGFFDIFPFMMKEKIHIRLHSILRKTGLSSVSKPVLICIFILLFVLLIASLVHFWPSQNSSDSQDFQVETNTSNNASQTDAAGSKILVDVEGCVKNPGLYELNSDSRIGHAIKAAGGFSKNASKASLNLAEKLDDGVQVYVPSKKENKSGAQNSTSSSSSASSSSGSANKTEKININTASMEELQKLNGIGEALSQRIIDYREKNGKFASIEDIKNVSGIGDSRFDSLKDLICV